MTEKTDEKTPPLDHYLQQYQEQSLNLPGVSPQRLRAYWKK